jgi:hypothetical protein
LASLVATLLKAVEQIEIRERETEKPSHPEPELSPSPDESPRATADIPRRRARRALQMRRKNR